MSDIISGLLLGYLAGTAGTLVTFFLASVAGHRREPEGAPASSEQASVA